jgi:hypothetical protein
VVYRVPGTEELPIARSSSEASITIPALGDWETLRLVGDFA